MAYNIRMGIPEMVELWSKLQKSYRDGTINKKDTDLYKKWGAARSYNLCIDSGKLGSDYATEAIIESIKIFDRTKISK